jgi:bis(5'-nucleosyl)-tetraphosphatase (symmetrical)
MSTYAIGDLQGCCQQMTALLVRIHTQSPDAKILFAGDVVNRGPQSLETLRKVRSLGNSMQMVLGNHDLHLLAVAQGIRHLHRSDTLQEILDAPDCDELLDWLRQQPLAYFEHGHLMVHAGVVPQWTAEQTLALAHEVETVLRGPDWINFLRNMYGNAPSQWNDDLEGMERLRCIVNVLTRIRFCNTEGVMDFATVEGINAAPSGYFPWFDVSGRKTDNVAMIFGHWSTLGLTLRNNLIGLDTGCVWGGKLTAVCLEDRSVLQVDCPQHQRPGKN